MLIVHLATVVLYAVAHDEVIDMQQHVVGGDLVKHLLRESYCGGFVLDDYTGFRLKTIENTVAAQPLVPHHELHFVGQHRLRITQMMGQVVDEMLTHPFLGGQRHVFPTQMVENHALAVTDDDFCVEGREV